MSEDNFDDEFDGSLPSGPRHPMARRFRGYLPVVVDVETGGFNSSKAPTSSRPRWNSPASSSTTRYAWRCRRKRHSPRSSAASARR